MRHCGSGRTAGQNELGKARQIGVVVGQPRIQPRDLLVADHRIARYRQFSAKVEQIVLNFREIDAYLLRQIVGQQHADR